MISKVFEEFVILRNPCFIYLIVLDCNCKIIWINMDFMTSNSYHYRINIILMGFFPLKAASNFVIIIITSMNFV